MEKKTNNNNINHNFGDLKQTNLNGKIIKDYKILRGHYFKFLETLYLNPETAITQRMLLEVWGDKVHKNTVYNFMKHALIRGWVIELKAIKGTEINSAYYYIKEPDKLVNGQIVSDRRLKYYMLTDEGKRVYELNKAKELVNAIK